jgi:hypothetical protein
MKARQMLQNLIFSNTAAEERVPEQNHFSTELRYVAIRSRHKLFLRFHFLKVLAKRQITNNKIEGFKA